MEEIVNRQIEAVLDKNILHTKDVFIPEYPVEQQVDFENPDYEVFPPEIESKASELFALVKPAGYFECYDLKNAGEDYEMSLLQKGLTDEIRINLNNMRYRMIVDGRELSAFEMFKQYPTLTEIVHNAVQSILHEQTILNRDIVH